MSDHKDSAFIDELPMVDIGDFFLWPGESGGPVFMISLNPLTNPDPRITREIHLDATAVYEFKIDLDGDSVADLSYKITVEGNVPTQKVTIRKAHGSEAQSNKPLGEVIATGDSTASGAKDAKVIYGSNREKLFVGPRQDPFFFDFRGLISPVSDDLRFALSADGLPTDGSAQDTFGPTNVTIVALEVPDLKGKKFGAWSVTSHAQDGKALDRAGRASITAIFLPNTPTGRNSKYYPYGGQTKQTYNETEPVHDRENYGKMFRYRLQQIQADEKWADFFLPDILTFDPARPQEYPNGRNLGEDAVFWMIVKLNPFCFIPIPAPTDEPFPRKNPQPLLKTFPYALPPANSYPYLDLSELPPHHHGG
jgi:Domain of unknown function (DUF4331)